jgi:hypothetical protein
MKAQGQVKAVAGDPSNGPPLERPRKGVTHVESDSATNLFNSLLSESSICQ